MDDLQNQKIATLEAQVSNFDRYMTKMDATLDRFAELSASIERVIAVHDERINNQERDIADIAQAQTIIHGRIDNIKSDISNRMEKIDRRMSEMEKWRWVVIGGISLAVFLVSNWSRLGAILGAATGS